MATKQRTTTTSLDRTFPTHIELAPDVRDQMIQLLNQHLADISDLKSQVKQAHWNVKGMHFFQLHKLFDKMAEELEEFIDTIAERATALGGFATGTVRMAAATSRLPELPTNIDQGKDYLTALAERYAQYGGSLREAIDQSEEARDMGTSDMFIDIVREIDKQLYFLESHLQA